MISLGWLRFKRIKRARAHLMIPLTSDGTTLTSRCRRFISPKPDHELPLIAPIQWLLCKDCLASEAKEGK